MRGKGACMAKGGGAFLFPFKFQNLCIRGLGLKVANFCITGSQEGDDRNAPLFLVQLKIGMQFTKNFTKTRMQSSRMRTVFRSGAGGGGV